MIDHFRIAKYRFICVAGPEGLLLPPYKGSTLRGGFGNAFKKITCYQPHIKSCKDCLVHAQCPYGYIFETAPTKGSEKLRNLESIPRPFVIEPPLDKKRDYLPGETLIFNLILFGRAIDFLPYFVITFEEMGRIGIGKGRKPFTLKQIEGTDFNEEQIEIIYSIENKSLQKSNLVIVGNELLKELTQPNTDINVVKVKFESITRLKFESHFVTKPEFHVLMRNILRRLSSLSYFHHDQEMDVNYKEVIEKAEAVRLKECNLKWVDWERYSSRQDTHMNLGGIVGEVTYQGNIEPFLPLLKLGEIIHVGKGTVFGLGKYRLLN